MKRRVITFSLDEETIKGLDELSELMGISRSRVVEMTLKTAVGGQSVQDFTKWLFSSIGKEEEEKTVLAEA